MIEEIIEFIEDFDKKDITLSVLFTTGRSGSVLLQSLLDNHHQVLAIPPILPIYNNWDTFYSRAKNTEELVESFFKVIRLIFSYDSYSYLGENKDCKASFYTEEVQLLLNNILPKLKEITRKNFLLSLAFSYAKVLDYDLSKIKAIIHHEHYLVYENDYNNFDSILEKSNNIINSIYHDFPKAKLLISIRNPLGLLSSLLKSNKDKSFFELYNLYESLFYTAFFNYYISENINKKNKCNVIFIKFEDLHLNTKETIQYISQLLNITYNESLLESTITGKLWFGNSPLLKPVLGTNSNFKDKFDDLDTQSKTILTTLLKKTLKDFNYYNTSVEKLNISILIKNEFESLVFLIFRELYYLNQLNLFNDNNLTNLFLSESYPLTRSKTLSYFLSKFLNIKNEINSENIEIDNISFFIKNILREQFKYPDNGFFIFSSIWEYGFLPIESVYQLNKLADQIWVTNSLVKKLYIDSGVIENKIQIVPFGINTESSFYDYFSNKSKKEVFHFENDESFKFLFIGNLDTDSGIDILIESFAYVSSKLRDVTLVIYDTSNSIRPNYQSLKNSNTNLLIKNNANVDWFNNLIKKFENLNIIVFNQLNYDFEIKYLYESCDCFVYPFRQDLLCINVMETMSFGLPIITTNNGAVLDFCNQENSYLINNEIEEEESNIIQDIYLKNNLFKFSPDKSHLSELMISVYQNRNDSQIKGLKGKNTILNDFTFEKTMGKVYSNITSLSNKSIFRKEFEKKEKDFNIKINALITKKDYDSAQDLITQLMPYDIKYFYKNIEILIKQNKYEEALDKLTEQLDFQDLNYELCYMIAQCLDRTGDTETAQEYYLKAKELSS
ncbi:MAG: glycosyltransferase [Candidatus Sericytochromatia bacterium]